MTEYRENCLTVREYDMLRRSVGWKPIPEEQAQRAIQGSIYTVTAVCGGQTAAMGRLIGDGLYYFIADVVTAPEYQRQGIGGAVIDMLLSFAERNTPAGGSAAVQLIAERGMEGFYTAKGFSAVPNADSGSAMQKIIRK